MAERDLVILSGGSRGLGAAVVRELLTDGYAVATFSRTGTPFVEECRAEYPSRFYWTELDITDSAGVERFVRSAVDRFGPVTTLVNNAAYAVDGLFLFTSPQDVRQALAVNVEALLNLTRLCLSSMLRERRGVVLNVSSVSAVCGIKGVAAYSATKAAVDGFTRSLAREVGPQGIRVNSVALGYFESESSSEMLNGEQVRTIIERTPLKRVGTVQDMVGLLRFLMSPEAAFITGHIFVVDGGLSC